MTTITIVGLIIAFVISFLINYFTIKKGAKQQESMRADLMKEYKSNT